MATYYISGAWFDTKNRITDVLIHTINADNTFQLGRKVTLAQMIYSLQNEKATVRTMVWNYQSAYWKIGPQVIVSSNASTTYIKTTPDGLTSDNLDNIIRMNGVVNV